ncbi:MAG: FtsH protease activity modulator HflK [Betaproteobacteria bacterium]|nr:FtsH protease activity modulator HflK [Betaproteobacteria bacterium]
MSLNDPQWGRKPGRGSGGNNNSGPPDLDEIWNNLGQRLNALFGRKGGGESPEPPRRTLSNLPLGGMGLLIAVILLIWLASGFYIVDQGRRGIVLTFGKYTETTLPGPRWHLPYPIQSVEVVNLSQVKTVEVGYRGSKSTKMPKESLMLTDDENIIDIQFAVQYNLKSVEDNVFNNREHDEEAVRQVAETSIREVVGKTKMDFVLNEGREQIAAQTKALMQEILDRYKTGVNVVRVTMQNAQPPEQVQGAFDEAVKAGQDRERQKNEGQAYSNDVVPKARGNASRLLEEAEGYAGRIVAEAEGNATRFKQVLAEYSKAPGVTRDRLYLDMMQSVLSTTSKVLVDQKGGNSLLYLPLDKLIAQGQVAGVAGELPRTAPAAETTVTIDAPSRARESLRGRER